MQEAPNLSTCEESSTDTKIIFIRLNYKALSSTAQQWPR